MTSVPQNNPFYNTGVLPKDLIPAGNNNGLDPQKPYQEYKTGGNPLRKPVKYNLSSDKPLPSSFPTNKWYQDLCFLANSYVDDFRVAVSPFNIKVLDSALINTAQQCTDLPGLELTSPKPYLYTGGDASKPFTIPTTYGLNRDFQDYTLGVDMGMDLGIAVGDKTVTETSETLNRTITYQDQFTLHTAWENTKLKGKVKAMLTRGSPYITFDYSKNIGLPVMVTGRNLLTISIIDADKKESAPYFLMDAPVNKKTFTGKIFKVVLGGVDNFASTQKNYFNTNGTLDFLPLYSIYMLYFSEEVTLNFSPSNNDKNISYQSLESIQPFIPSDANNNKAIFRIAYIKSVTGTAVGEDPRAPSLAVAENTNDKYSYFNQQATLTTYANVYPIQANLSLDIENGMEATQTIDWVTDYFGAEGDLLMTAFEETQIPFLQNLNKPAAEIRIPTLRGDMVGVIGKSWQLKINLPVELKDENLWVSRKIPDSHKEDLKTILQSEVGNASNSPGPIITDFLSFPPNDSYGFGKRIGKLARLALIADELGDTVRRDLVLTTMKDKLNAWFVNPKDKPYPDLGKQGYFQYDNKFGGVCTARALTAEGTNPATGYDLDYGSGQYTDHHFHFGYFLYAAATIAKFDVDWLNHHQDVVNLLASDIANPVENDPYFPAYRHFDWFEGHGFANGFVPSASGRNQESTSEALNAWYALSLWGQETKNEAMKNLGQIMAALEIRAAQAWTQITKDSFYNKYSIIPKSTFNKTNNQINMGDGIITGINWSLKTDHMTFFGNKLGYVVGIQVMPYTQITTALINKKFLEDNQTGLNTFLTQMNKNIELFANLDKIVEEYGYEYDKGEVQIDHANPVSYYWSQFQGLLNGVLHQWFLTVEPLMGLLDPTETDATIRTTLPDEMKKINEAFSASPRVKPCNPSNPKVMCIWDNNNQPRPIGIPFALPIYQRMDEGQSLTNTFWYLATCQQTPN